MQSHLLALCVHSLALCAFNTSPCELRVRIAVVRHIRVRGRSQSERVKSPS